MKYYPVMSREKLATAAEKELPPATVQSPGNKEVVAAPTTNIQWITSGLQKKQSPLSLKHWIATVLTLDGRDKFTKVLQYSCRLLGWYFAGLAARTSIGASSSSGGGGKIMSYEQMSQDSAPSTNHL